MEPAAPALFDENPDRPWHPKAVAILDYWRARSDGGRRVPPRASIDPVDIPQLLDGIWLLDVAAPFRLRYRLVGTRIVDALGQDPTGSWVDEAHPDAASTPEFFARFARVAETGVPSRRRGPAVFWFDRDRREIESVRLPLTSSGDRIDILMILTLFFRADGSTFD